MRNEAEEQQSLDKVLWQCRLVLLWHIVYFLGHLEMILFFMMNNICGSSLSVYFSLLNFRNIFLVLSHLQLEIYAPLKLLN